MHHPIITTMQCKGLLILFDKIYPMKNDHENEVEASSLIHVSTKKVLVEETTDQTTYYLPCYVRMKVKTVKELEIETFSGVIQSTLLCAIYYGNLPEHILNQFTGDGEKSIILQFNRKEAIELKESHVITIKHDKPNQLIDYVIRTEFECDLKGDVFFTPFEIFNLYLTVTFQTLILNPKLNKDRQISIKFNCMNTSRVSTILSDSELEHGTYSLAHYFLDSDYSNVAYHRFIPISVMNPHQVIDKDKHKKKEKSKKEDLEKKSKKEDLEKKSKEEDLEKKSKKEDLEMKFNPKAESSNINMANSCPPEELDSVEKEKLNNYQYAHFRIPLYKHPVSSLVQIFVPIWILAAINMGIYYQDCNGLADKIASIATVTLAFVAFIPTLNQKIPSTNIVKLIELIIYMQIGTTFLTLLDALTVRKKDPAVYETDWLNDWFYMSTLFINGISFCTVIMLYVLHKIWWEKVYTRKKEERVIGLNHHLWENKECDQHFKQMTPSNQIVPIDIAALPAILARPVLPALPALFFEKFKVSPQEGGLL